VYQEKRKEGEHTALKAEKQEESRKNKQKNS
jgi:hypothetical protein